MGGLETRGETALPNLIPKLISCGNPLQCALRPRRVFMRKSKKPEFCRLSDAAVRSPQSAEGAVSEAH